MCLCQPPFGCVFVVTSIISNGELLEYGGPPSPRVGKDKDQPVSIAEWNC